MNLNLFGMSTALTLVADHGRLVRLSPVQWSIKRMAPRIKGLRQYIKSLYKDQRNLTMTLQCDGTRKAWDRV